MENTNYKLVLFSYESDNPHMEEGFDGTLHHINHDLGMVAEKVYDVSAIGDDDLDNALKYAWTKLEVLQVFNDMDKYEFIAATKGYAFDSLVEAIALNIYNDYESIGQDVDFRVRDYLNMET